MSELEAAPVHTGARPHSLNLIEPQVATDFPLHEAASFDAEIGGVVWIDLENSPHVPFFQPLIEWLRSRGAQVLLTARNLSQTEELLNMAGLEFESIGGHAAGSRLARSWRSTRRGLQLAHWARGRHIDLAISHGSRAQAVASWLLRIPSMSFFDYEHASLGAYGLCTRVLVPECVSVDHLVRRGIPRHKLVSYPGYKEQVYLDPATDRWNPQDPPLILVRPPAVRAHYHTELSDRCYHRLLDRLADEAGHCRVLILPRYDTDERDLGPWLARAPHFEVLRGVAAGRDLILEASMVASGGGTMVREAAVLGVPAVSFFGGPIGAVDVSLVESRRLVMVRSEADVDGVGFPVSPRSVHVHEAHGNGTHGHGANGNGANGHGANGNGSHGNGSNGNGVHLHRKGNGRGPTEVGNGNGLHAELSKHAPRNGNGNGNGHHDGHGKGHVSGGNGQGNALAHGNGNGNGNGNGLAHGNGKGHAGDATVHPVPAAALVSHSAKLVVGGSDLPGMGAAGYGQNGHHGHPSVSARLASDHSNGTPTTDRLAELTGFESPAPLPSTPRLRAFVRSEVASWLLRRARARS